MGPILPENSLYRKAWFCGGGDCSRARRKFELRGTKHRISRWRCFYCNFDLCDDCMKRTTKALSKTTKKDTTTGLGEVCKLQTLFASFRFNRIRRNQEWSLSYHPFYHVYKFWDLFLFLVFWRQKFWFQKEIKKRKKCLICGRFQTDIRSHFFGCKWFFMTQSFAKALMTLHEVQKMGILK